jgi:hypothetical protein
LPPVYFTSATGWPAPRMPLGTGTEARPGKSENTMCNDSFWYQKMAVPAQREVRQPMGEL